MRKDISPFIGHYEGYDLSADKYLSQQAMVTQQVRTLFDGSAVKRFHTIPTVTENTVGQHSHGVAMFCVLLTGATCSAPLLMAALSHDLAEQYVGDIPSPSKRTLGVREELGAIEDALLATVRFDFELSVEDQLVLKLADCADGMLFCVRERMLGNKSKMIAHAYRNYAAYVHSTIDKLVADSVVPLKAAYVFGAVDQLWEENK